MEASNVKAMRNALKETQSVIEKCMEILNRIPDGVEYDGLIDDVAGELCDLRDSHVKPALSAPPRNCDVGTTQEMRDVAQCLHYNSPTQLTIEAAAMLRQAAEMRERAEELKAQCLKICGRETCDHKGDKCVCCARDVIDFIVRGDAGKKEKK